MHVHLLCICACCCCCMYSDVSAYKCLHFFPHLSNKYGCKRKKTLQKTIIKFNISLLWKLEKCENVDILSTNVQMDNLKSDKEKKKLYPNKQSLFVINPIKKRYSNFAGTLIICDVSRVFTIEVSEAKINIQNKYLKTIQKTNRWNVLNKRRKNTEKSVFVLQSKSSSACKCVILKFFSFSVFFVGGLFFTFC